MHDVNHNLWRAAHDDYRFWKQKNSPESFHNKVFLAYMRGGPERKSCGNKHVGLKTRKAIFVTLRNGPRLLSETFTIVSLRGRKEKKKPKGENWKGKVTVEQNIFARNKPCFTIVFIPFRNKVFCSLQPHFFPVLLSLSHDSKTFLCIQLKSTHNCDILNVITREKVHR